MKTQQTMDDYEWVYNEEPHVSRRKAMLKKYPELKALMGIDPMFKYIVSALVFVQLFMFWVLKDSSMTVIIVTGYIFGGVINHSLAIAIHEIAHNAAFGNSHPRKNKLFGIFANLPIGLPFSVTFKRYHTDHHKFQAVQYYDPDIPSELEARLFRNAIGKTVWLFLQPYFYITRPLFLNPKNITFFEAVQFAVQIIFDIIIYHLCGFKMIIYMIFGTSLTMGIHPQAGHFIAEHYVFKKGEETYSYHGSMNWITFNVGYHMEHHDFPNIPGSRLAEVSRIAKEFYEDIPIHTSWIKVLYQFITRPDITLYSRIVRKTNRTLEAQRMMDETKLID